MRSKRISSKVRERATAVRAALKEWLGWWAGLLELLLAADWSSKLGNAAARSSLSSRPDLHWDFRTRDDREVINTEQDSRVSLHNDVLEEKGRCIDGI